MFRTDRVIGIVGTVATLIGTAIAFYIGVKTPEYKEVCWRISVGILGISIGLMFGLALGFGAKKPAVSKSSDPFPIRVLSGNGDMFLEVVDLINRTQNNGGSIKDVHVTVIQCSGANVHTTVSELLKAGAKVEIYLAAAHRGENKHQKKQISDWDMEQLKNHLPTLSTPDRYIYDAPAAMRAVLIEGHMVFAGSYYYEVVKRGEQMVLDSRGHDMPLFAVPCGHPGFELLKNSILALAKNWKDVKNSETGKATAVRKDQD